MKVSLIVSLLVAMEFDPLHAGEVCVAVLLLAQRLLAACSFFLF